MSSSKDMETLEIQRGWEKAAYTSYWICEKIEAEHAQINMDTEVKDTIYFN